MNITNFKETPYFDSLPRYALPALQAAFDKALNNAFSSLAIYNGICRDFAEVGLDKPKQHVFNDWIEGIRKKTVSRPGGEPITEETDQPSTEPGVAELATDTPARDADTVMMQRRVMQSGQLRINGKYFKAEGALPGTEVLVRPDPRDANRYSMFGLDGGRYVGEAVCVDAAPAEREAMPLPAEVDGTAVEHDQAPTYLGKPVTDPDLLIDLKRRAADTSLNYVGVDLAKGSDQSVTTVVAVDEGKPFFTSIFPDEDADTLVERMIAAAKADLMRDFDAQAKRLAAERLRQLASDLEGGAR